MFGSKLYLNEGYVSVPNVGVRWVLPAGIQNSNFRCLFGTGIYGVDVKPSEILGKIALLFRRQALLGKEDDLVGEKGLVNLIHLGFVEVFAQVDAVDDGPDGRRELPNRRVGAWGRHVVGFDKRVVLTNGNEEQAIADHQVESRFLVGYIYWKLALSRSSSLHVDQDTAVQAVSRNKRS